MKIKIENMKIKQDLTKQGVLDFACEKMRIKHDLVEDFQILKKSIDARNKNDIFYNYSVLIDVKENNVSKSFLKNIGRLACAFIVALQDGLEPTTP